MKTYTLTLTDEALKVISAGLGELPAKHAMPVIGELNRQLAPQLKPEPVTKTEDKAA